MNYLFKLKNITEDSVYPEVHYVIAILPEHVVLVWPDDDGNGHVDTYPISGDDWANICAESVVEMGSDNHGRRQCAAR